MIEQTETKTQEIVTPEQVYQTAVAAEGKVALAEMAKQLGMRSDRFTFLLTSHCIANQLPLPAMKLKEDPKPAEPPKVLERNSKRALVLPASRLAYLGFDEFDQWETEIVSQGILLIPIELDKREEPAREEVANQVEEPKENETESEALGEEPSEPSNDEDLNALTLAVEASGI